jgi:hypothetical protein
MLPQQQWLPASCATVAVTGEGSPLPSNTSCCLASTSHSIPSRLDAYAAAASMLLLLLLLLLALTPCA